MRKKMPALVMVEIVIGALVSFLSMYVFLLLTKLTLTQELIAVDAWVESAVVSLRNPWLTQVMIGVSLFGREILIILTVIITCYFLIKKWYYEAFFLGFVILTSWLLTRFLKALIQRPRPEILALVQEGTYSYPSGHVLVSMIFYATVCYLILHFTRNKTLSSYMVVLSGALIVLIGFSRIYLGVHYLSDVIAGFIAGIWWFIAILVLRKIAGI